MRVIGTIATLAVFLAACAAEDQSEGPATTTSTSTETTSDPRSVTPTTSTTAPLGTYLPESLIDQAVTKAATEAGLSPNEIDVISAVQVTWSDAALGCAAEGQLSAQVLTDGYWVLLRSDYTTMDYRSDMSGEFRLCVDGQPPVSTYLDR